MEEPSNYPESGQVEIQFNHGSIHAYPLFSDDASLVISEPGNLDDSEIDATVSVEYMDEEVEYAIHVSDGGIPSEWVLTDIVIWADAVELGDTRHGHDNLRNPDTVRVQI